MSSSQSSSRSRKRNSAKPSRADLTSNTTISKSTGPYDRAFQQNLIDGGIYPDGYEYPDGRALPQPRNWEEINERLAQPRPSLSPSKFSDADFRRFRRADANAFKEKQITTSVIPIIEGEPRDPKCVSGSIPFTNLDHLTDGTLKPGNPDLYYGARPEQIERPIRVKLSNRIQPTTQTDCPFAPNFFLAAKGPNGTGAVAKRQACYDGALGARGMHSLQSYGQEELRFDGNAYTITSSYSDGQLKMYTSHPIQPTNTTARPEYVMTHVRSFAMTDTAETFRQGARWFRNGIEWTTEERNKAITLANTSKNANAEYQGPLPMLSNSDPASGYPSETSDDETYAAQTTSQGSMTSLTAQLEESESSPDELTLDFETVSKSRRKRPRR